MRTLNLGRLITCDLNPLKACSQAIADAFVDAANQHQISYCRTILERNQRSTLPTMISEQDDVGNSAWQVTSSSLETFFPYDPFLLNRYLSLCYTALCRSCKVIHLINLSHIIIPEHEGG